MCVVSREFTFIIENLALGTLTFTTFDRHIAIMRFKCIDPEYTRMCMDYDRKEAFFKFCAHSLKRTTKNVIFRDINVEIFYSKP